MSEEKNIDIESVEEESEPVRRRSPCDGCHNEGPQCLGCIDAPSGSLNFW